MAINATAVWRVRYGSSFNINGGGYDAAISGAGTDYSQQDSPQAMGLNGAGTTAVFTDLTANAFTSAMVGNAMYIVGSGGATAGWYFVVGYTSSSVVTLDRSPGVSYSSVIWRLGGGWSDPYTNLQSTGPVVPGNIVYVLGSGVPNPSSYTYDYADPGSTVYTPAQGSPTTGYITIAGDPATPSSGVPCLQMSGNIFNNNPSGTPLYWKFKNLWLVLNGSNNQGLGCFATSGGTLLENVTMDQFGYDTPFFTNILAAFRCEATSSVSSRGSNSTSPLGMVSSGFIYCNNIHDCLGAGMEASSAGQLTAFGNVFSKNGGDGLQIGSSVGARAIMVFNNTFDNNLGNGITIAAQLDLADLSLFNNIIANHTAGGTYGISVSAGSTAANDVVQQFVDWNTFYNNTTNVNAISLGPNSTATGTDPFNNEASNDWTLVPAFYNAGVTPAVPLPQNITGWNG